MHGLSTILAIIMIVIIVISVVGLFYSFSASLTETTMSTAESSVNTTTTNMLTQMRVITMSLNDALVKNTGLNDISASSISVLINNNPANFTLTPPVIKPNEIGTVKIYDFIKENDDISIGTGSIFTDEKAPDPCDQAVLCLNFDEGYGTSATDSSGNGNNGVFNGETFNDGTSYSGASTIDLHTSPGKFGKAIQFDGSNDYALVADADSLDFGTGSFTVIFWFKPSKNPTVNAGVLYKGFLPGWGIWWRSTQQIMSRWGFSVSNYLDVWSDAGKPISLNDWHSVAFVVNRSSQRAYFVIDSVKHTEYDSSSIGSVSNGNLFYLGFETEYFNGTVDEVRFFNRSLSLEEIQAEIQSSMPVSRTVASYSFEESGNYANDTHIWVQGKYGKALSFDGVDDCINVTNSPSLQNLNYITIEMWLKPVARNTFHTYITKFGTPFNWELWSAPTTTNTITMYWSVNTTTRVDVPFNLQSGNWYHLALIFNGSIAKAYVNNNFVNSADLSGMLSKDTENVVIMRRTDMANPGQGIIDEVRIYSKAIY